MRKKQRVQEFIEYFSENLPEAKTELHYTNAFELTIAVVLSAQCTDKRVNIITPPLFEAFPTPEVMAEASIDYIFDLQIFFNTKPCSKANKFFNPHQ